MINKNISIWRGSAIPPTNYHLWEKEDGGLYVYLDEKWQHLVTPADKTILDKHQQQLDKIKNLALTEIDPIDTNTYKSYQLKSDDNIFGTTINIPKDKLIKQVTLGYDNATIDTSTGEITIGTGLSKEYLLFSVALQSGSYELVSINLTNFLTEKDYSDGLEVVDNKLKVKVDPSSEEYLEVSNNGIKIEGINTNFNKVNERLTTISNTQIKRSEMGVANGVATLDTNNTIPYNQLPTIADDEDLIEVNNRLKLKDRIYNPDNFNGKGYKILRKNIVEGKNILTQDMINDSNTVYEIRYDFDLDGAEITIPKDCVLNFQGGSLDNGSIVGNKTSILSNSVCFYNIDFDGTFTSEPNIDWFPIVYNIESDNSTLINRALYLAYLSDKKLVLKRKSIIYVNSVMEEYSNSNVAQNGTINVKSGVCFDLNESTIKTIPNNSKNYNIIFIGDADNVTICNGIIEGDVKTHKGTSGEWGYGIAVQGCINFTIKDIICRNCWGDGINITKSKNRNSKNGLLERCVCDSNRRQGMSVESIAGLLVKNCIFKNTGVIKATAPTSGVDLEPGWNTELVSDVEFINCTFNNNKSKGLFIYDTGLMHDDWNNLISNVRVINCDLHSNGDTDLQLTANNILVEDCNRHLSKGLKVYYYYDVKNVSIINSLLQSILIANNTILSGTTIKDSDFIFSEASWVIKHTGNGTLTLNNCSYIGSMLYTNNFLEGVDYSNSNATIVFDKCNFDNTGSYKYIKITDKVIIENSNFKNLDFRFVGSSENGIINFKNNFVTLNNSSYIGLLHCAFDNGCNYTIDCSGLNVMGDFGKELVNNTNANSSLVVVLKNSNVRKISMSQDYNSNVIIRTNLNSLTIKTKTKDNNGICFKVPKTNALLNCKTIKSYDDTPSLYNTDANIVFNKSSKSFFVCPYSISNGKYISSVYEELKNAFAFATNETEDSYVIYLSKISRKAIIGSIDLSFYKIDDFETEISIQDISSIDFFVKPSNMIGLPSVVNFPTYIEKYNSLRVYDTQKKQEYIYIDNVFKQYDTIQLGIKRKGLFSDKPTEDSNIDVGFTYFCTDRKTAEGGTNGIVIYYKGNNVWVDALGRVVDNSYPTLVQDTTT